MHDKKIGVQRIPSLESLGKSFEDASFQGRNVGLANKIFKEMADSGTTIFLTLAGAITPTGLGGMIIEAMELGFIDIVVSTGANLTHDIHFALNTPLFKCNPERIDDIELRNKNMERIYDIILHPSCLTKTAEFIRSVLRKYGHTGPRLISTAEFNYWIGKEIYKNSPYPNRSVLAKAYESEIPIYTPSPGDSELGMNCALFELDSMIANDINGLPTINPNLDVNELTALTISCEKTGTIVVGGGAPKNFTTQVYPYILEEFIYPGIKRDFPDFIKRQPSDINGHDCMIKITTDSPYYGGCSGASSSENTAWKKINPKSLDKDEVTVHADATIILPILFSHVKANCKKRNLKRLYKKRPECLKTLAQIREKRVAVLGYEPLR